MFATSILDGANMPLHKIANPAVVKFMEEHTIFAAPSESTLRTKYFPELYEDCIDRLIQIAANKDTQSIPVVHNGCKPRVHWNTPTITEYYNYESFDDVVGQRQLELWHVKSGRGKLTKVSHLH